MSIVMERKKNIVLTIITTGPILRDRWQ